MAYVRVMTSRPCHRPRPHRRLCAPPPRPLRLPLRRRRRPPFPGCPSALPAGACPPPLAWSARQGVTLSPSGKGRLDGASKNGPAPSGSSTKWTPSVETGANLSATTTSRQRLPSQHFQVQVVAPGVGPGIRRAAMVSAPALTVSPSASAHFDERAAVVEAWSQALIDHDRRGAASKGRAARRPETLSREAVPGSEDS
jgi:hypothetical protein